LLKKWLLITVLVIGLLLLLAGGGLFGLYTAARHVPEAYRHALELGAVDAAQGSDQMLQKTTTLASDVKNKDKWSAIFSADQINGWFAVDLVKNHADTLPAGISNPRVAIRPGEMTVFCRLERGRFQSVLSLALDAYLPEPNVIAVRVRKARAGALPLPLEQILDEATEALHRWNLRVRWQQTDGDPVALVTIPPPRNSGQKYIRLEDLRLGDGELYVAGSTHEG
jgi:hypothetical protein